MQNDVSEMSKAANKMKTPTAKQFTMAIKQLKNDVDSIPSNATLEQVNAKLHTDIANARASGRQLAVESGCPQPPRNEDQQQTPQP